MDAPQVTSFLPVASGILAVSNGIWGYFDAKRMGVSGIALGIILTVTFPIGLLVWIIVRDRISRSR